MASCHSTELPSGLLMKAGPPSFPHDRRFMFRGPLESGAPPPWVWKDDDDEQRCWSCCSRRRSSWPCLQTHTWAAGGELLHTAHCSLIFVKIMIVRYEDVSIIIEYRLSTFWSFSAIHDSIWVPCTFKSMCWLVRRFK